MRSETIVQFPGSQVTHLPVFLSRNGQTTTNCGRVYDGIPWTTGYYGEYSPVTCKSCANRIPSGAMFNRQITPYRHAKVGDDVQVFSHNGNEALPASEYKVDGCEYVWLPSKDGDPNGLLVEWYEAMGMWTVFMFNANAPHLRRFQVRSSPDGSDHVVVDSHDNYKVVGRTQTESAANHMARKRNQGFPPEV